MKALEALHLANEAGLTLESVPQGLKVRGPRQARAALLPILAPMAGEIANLLAASDLIRGDESIALREARDRCTGCGGKAWTVSVVMDDGGRVCPACWAGRGRS